MRQLSSADWTMVALDTATAHNTIGIVGIIFLLVWVLIAYLRSEVKRRQDRGLLPGQQ